MILGIDEVGRGCWAGPVAAGAVALRVPLPSLADSKTLSKKTRERLDALIRAEALAFGVGWASVEEIDSLGLTEAVRLAMRRAVLAAEESACQKADELIVDGKYNFFADDVRARVLVGADALIPSVSAASILAKVARDRWMSSVASKDFPAYGFEKHVGYGTALHRERLQLHGVSALHRRSFRPIKELLNGNDV
ncbi:MAG TPA: ribonuclease HII [Candidatus Saccharimonadales bacterium]